MRVINVDQESIDLLEAAAEMSMAALSARASRLDPDEVISRSYRMSKFKVEGALRELRRPAPIDLSKFEEQDAKQFHDLLEAFMASTDAGIRDVIFRKLRASMFRYPPGTQALRERNPVRKKRVQKPALADPSTRVEE